MFACSNLCFKIIGNVTTTRSVMRFLFPLFSYRFNFSLIIAKSCNLFKTTWVAIQK